MMDTLLRSVAVFIEVALLMAIFYHILNGVRLILFDLGLTLRYSKIITVVLFAVGSLLLAFFASHLTSLYPTI